MENLSLGQKPLKIWTDGAAKVNIPWLWLYDDFTSVFTQENHVAGIGRIAGVGVVFDSDLPSLYGPVEFNLTERATNNAAELQAAILGLEHAKQKGFNFVELNTDSKLLHDIMTKWLDQWKANSWKKSEEKPVKISSDLVKKLDKLSSEMDISWKWLPRNSCTEMVLADALANHACTIRVQAQEMEANYLFRRTVYNRRLAYPDELPPTVLRTKEEVLISNGENVSICCTLDVSETLKQHLIENEISIKNLSSDQAYGLVTCLRTFGTMAADGTVMANCHSWGSEFVAGKSIQPTLVLPRGSVVGLSFSGSYASSDEVANKNLMGMLFFTQTE